MTACETPLARTGSSFVRWVKGLEVLRLFEYDEETRLFTETRPGMAATRATVLNGTDFAVTIEGTMVLLMASLAGQWGIQAAFLNAKGGTADRSGGVSEARVEFWYHGTRVATVTKAGRLTVSGVTMGAPVAGVGFGLNGGGVLRGSLGPAVAAEFRIG